MTKTNKSTKTPQTKFGAVLPRIIFILAIAYWLLLFIGFVWDRAYTDFYAIFTFGQYGLTILITALIMLATIPIACHNVARPLSALMRLLAPFSTFCIFQATSSIARLLNANSTVLNICSWICFALVFIIFILTACVLKKFKSISEKQEQDHYKSKQKLFTAVLVAEFIFSFAYICIICTILPREISLYLRYAA